MAMPFVALAAPIDTDKVKIDFGVSKAGDCGIHNHDEPSCPIYT